MLKPVGHVTAWRHTYAAAADAFLLAGAGFLLLVGGLGLLFRQPSVWSEVLSQVALVGSVVAGTAIAWRLHGHRLTRRTWLGVVLGTIAGALVGGPAFFALFMLGRLIPFPMPDREGPWGSVLLVSVVVVVFLALPVYWGVRDLVTRSGSQRVVVVRLSALAVIVAAVVITVGIGGETAEAGLFMVPVSAASAVAVFGVALFGSRRPRGREVRGS